MAEGIIRGGGGGIDVSDANAKPLQVVKGYTFYSDRSEDPQVGTMPDMSGTSIVITPDETGTIPAGYHDGTGTIKADLSAQTAGAEDILEGTKIFVPNEEGGYVLVQGEIPVRTKDDVAITWSEDSVLASAYGGYYPTTTIDIADEIDRYAYAGGEEAYTYDWDGYYAAQNIFIEPYYTATTPSRTASNVTLNINNDTEWAQVYYPYGYYANDIDKQILSVFDPSSHYDTDNPGWITPTSSVKTLATSGKVLFDPINVGETAISRCTRATCTSGSNSQTLTFTNIDFEPNGLIVFTTDAPAPSGAGIYYVDSWNSLNNSCGYKQYDTLPQYTADPGIITSLDENNHLVVIVSADGFYWAPQQTFYAVAIAW